MATYKHHLCSRWATS